MKTKDKWTGISSSRIVSLVNYNQQGGLESYDSEPLVLLWGFGDLVLWYTEISVRGVSCYEGNARIKIG